MGLIMLGALGFVALVVVLFFILKLFSVALFNIPGSAYVFELCITAIPFFILFAAYYVVHKKIAASKTNASSVAARVILTIGSLICVIQLVFALLLFFNVRTEWLLTYSEYDRAGFALHVIVILISAGVLATGDEKQKNWLERKTDH